MAVSVTVLPCGNEEEQAWPQSIPLGELVTVPLPPSITTSSVNVGSGTAVAVLDGGAADAPGADITEAARKARIAMTFISK